MDGKIGVLALQGAFEKHKEKLQALNIQAIEVKEPEQLSQCQGLILPGGESTVMMRRLHDDGFIPMLIHFAERAPLFGTCAGMIVMANLGLLSIEVNRNGYGRQLSSFSTPLSLSTEEVLEGHFIRAPRIKKINSPQVHLLASFNGEPVCIREKHHLACTFHPELTNDFTLHNYFLKMVLHQIWMQKQSLQQPLKTTPTKSFQMT